MVPRPGLDFGEQKILFPLPEIAPYFVCSLTHNLVAVNTEISNRYFFAANTVTEDSCLLLAGEHIPTARGILLPLTSGSSS